MMSESLRRLGFLLRISRQMQVNLCVGRHSCSTVGIMKLDLFNKLHNYHETVIVPYSFI